MIYIQFVLIYNVTVDDCVIYILIFSKVLGVKKNFCYFSSIINFDYIHEKSNFGSA